MQGGLATAAVVGRTIINIVTRALRNHILGPGEDGRHGERVSLVIQDRFTGWL